MASKADKTEDPWRARLSPERYEVMRRKGTERPWSGEHNRTKDPGVFRCAACGTELFTSDAKFESGSGWPSFFEPSDPQSVRREEDRGLFMRRTEVLCASCDSHLGHVFDDGPQPTGERYCINSVALDFQPADDDQG